MLLKKNIFIVTLVFEILVLTLTPLLEAAPLFDDGPPTNSCQKALRILGISDSLLKDLLGPKPTPTPQTPANRQLKQRWRSLKAQNQLNSVEQRHETRNEMGLLRSLYFINPHNMENLGFTKRLDLSPYEQEYIERIRALFLRGLPFAETLPTEPTAIQIYNGALIQLAKEMIKAYETDGFSIQHYLVYTRHVYLSGIIDSDRKVSPPRSTEIDSVTPMELPSRTLIDRIDLVMGDHADPKRSKYLSQIRQKLGITKISLVIDHDFFKGLPNGSFSPDFKTIETSALANLFPRAFLTNPIFLHELVHASHKQATMKRQQRPYLGFIHFNDPKDSLITLESYTNLLGLDEIPALQKIKKWYELQLGLIPQPSAHFNETIKPEILSMQTNFQVREAARSALLIIDQIKARINDRSYRREVTFHIYGANYSASRVDLPLGANPFYPSGHLCLYLVKLHNGNADQKFNLLADYLDQMQDQILEDFFQAEDEIQALKGKATASL